MGDLIKRSDAIKVITEIGTKYGLPRCIWETSHAVAALDAAEALADSPLLAVAMRDKAVKIFMPVTAIGETEDQYLKLSAIRYTIRAIPTTFTHAELIAAAAELAEVKALVSAACEQWQYMQTCRDWGDLENNLGLALAPFARKGE